MWSIILNDIANSFDSKEDYSLFFLSIFRSVSKEMNKLTKQVINKIKSNESRKRKSPMDFSAYLAGNGYLSCLQYAHQNGWNERTCSFAALNGHVDCLQYAHENGCKWNEDTCSGAALNGHVDCLQ